MKCRPNRRAGSAEAPTDTSWFSILVLGSPAQNGGKQKCLEINLFFHEEAFQNVQIKRG
jgi:hypothetical protein